MQFSLLCLFFTLLVIVEIKPSVSLLSCPQQKIKSDNCMKNVVLVGHNTAVIPKNAEELEIHHCRRSRKDTRCVHQYARCLKPFPRTVFNRIISNVKKMIKRFCGSREGKEEFVRHMQCFTPDVAVVLNQVLNALTIIFDYISTTVATDEIISWACCVYYRVQEDAKKELDNLCLSKTGPETSEYILGLVRAVATDAIDLGCGQYSTVDACNRSLPHAMDKFRDLTWPVTKITPQNHTLLVSLINIVGRLDSEVNI